MLAVLEVGRRIVLRVLARDTLMAATCSWAAAALAVLLPAFASAQELEPGASWPIATGVKIVTAVNTFNWGDLAFDPSAPIDEGSAAINTTAFAFTRSFSLAGRSANAGVVLPVVGGHVDGLYLGEPAEVSRFGLGDPRLRLAMNLYRGPGDGAEGIRVLPPADHRRGQRHGGAATGQYRLEQADQSGHQSLVLPARDWGVSRLWPVGRRGDGRRLVVHGQHGLRSEGERGSRIRLSRRSST